MAWFLTTRIICFGAFTVALVAQTGTTAQATQHRLYFGTYTQGDSTSDGIYTSLFDDSTGQLTEAVLIAETENPSFLALHPTQPLLYCVNELTDFAGKPQGAISAFSIDATTGDLRFINQQPSGGGAPCHLNVDAGGRYVLAANYMGGNTVVLPIGEDGRLHEASCLIQHEGDGPDKQRQEAPHAHSVNLGPSNQKAYVADLGTDKIWVFNFDAQHGRLTPASPAFASGVPGGGPRHLAFHPSAKYAWSNNEMTATVMSFHRDPKTGGLERFQELSTLPEGDTGRRSTAECLVHPSGKYVYVSNRGHDSIAAFSVGDDGRLERVQIQNSGGEEPRNFFIMPDGKWLLAANQNSDTVVVFRIRGDGTLEQTAEQIPVSRPVCIRRLHLTE
jgi:6-phosphogluconolactonase